MLHQLSTCLSVVDLRFHDFLPVLTHPEQKFCLFHSLTTSTRQAYPNSGFQEQLKKYDAAHRGKHGEPGVAGGVGLSPSPGMVKTTRVQSCRYCRRNSSYVVKRAMLLCQTNADFCRPLPRASLSPSPSPSLPFSRSLSLSLSCLLARSLTIHTYCSCAVSPKGQMGMGVMPRMSPPGTSALGSGGGIVHVTYVF